MYKRQEGVEPGSTLGTITGLAVTTASAVSYTHLDVYKRQAVHSVYTIRSSCT